MIKWSFSGLKQYVNCPKQYHEVKILNNYTVTVTEQMLYGSAVHKALEDYVRDGVPLAKNYERFKPAVDALLEVPGMKYPELQMALKADRVTPCAFDDPEYWVRGIADLLSIDRDTAYIIDYKTGSARYPDPKQLKLMALMVFAKFPGVDFIKAGLLFVMHDVFIDEQYHRREIPKLWEAFDPSLARLTVSHEQGTWNANPSPLCGWCPVTSCDFYKPKRHK
jgi:hypothetical protein